MVNLEKLNYGFGITISKKDLIDHCQLCKKKLNLSSFYYCEQNDKFYCDKCRINHITRRNHTDWHITKITFKEED